MTKKLIVGIIVIISLALIVGYIAGSQHIPFSKSINLIYTQNFSSDSERFEKIDPILMETNIESLINIENTGDIEKKRIQLINFIWKSNSLQNSEMPEKIINYIDDPGFSEIKNLLEIISFTSFLTKINIPRNSGISRNSEEIRFQFAHRNLN